MLYIGVRYNHSLTPVRTASLQSKIRKSSDSQQNQGFFRFWAEAEYGGFAK